MNLMGFGMDWFTLLVCVSYSVVRFFDDRADSQKSLWLRSNEFVNSILLPRDTIGYEIIPNSDYFNVGIVFGGKQKNLEILLSRARP